MEPILKKFYTRFLIGLTIIIAVMLSFAIIKMASATATVNYITGATQEQNGDGAIYNESENGYNAVGAVNLSDPFWLITSDTGYNTTMYLNDNGGGIGCTGCSPDIINSFDVDGTTIYAMMFSLGEQTLTDFQYAQSGTGVFYGLLTNVATEIDSKEALYTELGVETGTSTATSTATSSYVIINKVSVDTPVLNFVAMLLMFVTIVAGVIKLFMIFRKK